MEQAEKESTGGDDSPPSRTETDGGGGSAKSAAATGAKVTAAINGGETGAAAVGDPPVCAGLEEAGAAANPAPPRRPAGAIPQAASSASPPSPPRRADKDESWLVSGRRRWLERLCLALSGLALAAAFPWLNLSFLGWVGLIPLYWIVRSATPARAWRGGYLWGYFWSLASFFWLREISIVVPFLLAGILALFPAFWAAAAPFLRRHLLSTPGERLRGGANYYSVIAAQTAAADWRRPWKELIVVLSLAAWWCVLEWTRSWIATGLPWNFLGVSQWRNIPVIQIAEYTGVYGVSFLLVTFNLAVAVTIERWQRLWRFGGRYQRPVPFIAALVLVMAAVLVGSRSMMAHRGDEKEGGVRFTAAVLQGNIPQCRFATSEEARGALSNYLELSELALIGNPDLVVWPETAVPYAFRSGGEISAMYRYQVLSLIEKHRVPFLIGTLDFAEVPDDFEGVPPMHNSALFIDADGKIAAKYHKIHLVPFGEYVPFSRHLPFLEKWIGMGRDLEAGTDFAVIPLAVGVRAAVNICFEDIFPYVSRRQALRGANLLVVLTNDAWYPTSSEPEQHLANAVFRAVETRLPMIRAGNDSCSVLVAPNGSIINSVLSDIDPAGGKPVLTPAKRGRGLANFTVWLDESPPTTFHTRNGDVFIALCVFIFGAAMTAAIFSWRDERQALLAAGTSRGAAI